MSRRLNPELPWQHDYQKRWIIRIRHRSLLIPRGVHMLHAGPRGSLLLREEVRLSNWSGFVLATRRSTIWIYFRRRPRT